MTKHIAFYIGSLHKGGAERVFVNLAEFFYSQGYKVTIVTQYRKTNEYPLSSGINRVISDLTEEEISRNRVVNYSKRFFKLRKIWKQSKPDLVLSCIGKNNFMALLTTSFLSTKAVVSVVGEPTEEYYTPMMKLLAKTIFIKADGIVLQTKDSAAFFPTSIRKKAVILKNSLNPAFMKGRFTETREKTIVSVGRLDANKNQSLLIGAFAKIAKDYPEYRVILYGEGENREKLEQEVQQFGMKDRIILPGITTDVVTAIQKASVFVLTSFTEGMPNALIEAMALGLAVISTDCPCGGPATLIQHGENGMLVPVGDVECLAECLDIILGNQELETKLGSNASQIQNKYSREKILKEWEGFIDNLTKQSAQPPQ